MMSVQIGFLMKQISSEGGFVPFIEGQVLDVFSMLIIPPTLSTFSCTSSPVCYHPQKM